MSVYSHWLQQAFPQPHQRQEYFRRLIENKPLSPASLRLGHLLLEKSVTNVLVTPNFDDFVSRSLTVFGSTHRLCDHPATTDRIDAEEADIQIVHVHGTFWFYDCCNLAEEIEARAEQDVDTTVSMAGLLDRLLARRSPLVIGYSGWDGDVIMAALQRRLQTGLRSNLYWFSYKRSDVDALPTWLREHRNVVFVLPETASHEMPNEEDSAAPANGDGPDGCTQQPIMTQPVKPADEPTMPAQRVFDEFIQELGLSAPMLSEDPLGFFVESLRATYEDSKGPGDLYGMASTVSRIERAREWDANQVAKQEEQERSLELIRDALRRSQYTELLTQASEIDTTALKDEELSELAGAAYTAAIASDETNAEQWTLAVNLLEGLAAAQPETESLSQRLVSALRRKAESLKDAGQLDEALVVWDDVATRFANHDEFMGQLAFALYNKANALDDAGRQDETLATLNELIELYREKPQAASAMAWALLLKGRLLGDRGERDEAIAAYDEIERGFAAAPDEFGGPLAWSLVKKANYMRGSGEFEDAVNAYKDMLIRFSNVTVSVSWAMLSRAECLVELERQDDALVQFEELLKKFHGVGDADYQLAKALRQKAEILANRDDRNAAAETYRQLVEQFLSSEDDATREMAEEAQLRVVKLLEPEADTE